VLEEESHQTSSEVDVTVDNNNGPQLQVRSPVLLVLNKADLSNQGGGGGGGGGGEGGVVLDRLETPHHSISCVSGEGIGALEQAISDAVRKLLESGGSGESPLITRERHRRHVTQCALHLENFLARTLPMDAAAEELRSVVDVKLTE
jgi:tRNA U34 5-carboxymethylaminomethyl modifying GTPase MnmE/TrmE